MTSKPRITPPGISVCTLSATRPPTTTVVPARVGAGQLIFRIAGVTQTGFQVNDAVITKGGAKLTVIRVNSDQAGIDGVHQDTTLTGVTGGQVGRGTGVEPGTSG